MVIVLKAYGYLWGTVAFIFSVFAFPLAWGNDGMAFAVFCSPVAIFVASLVFGPAQHSWAPALHLYGSLLLIIPVAAVATARIAPAVPATKTEQPNH